MKQLGVRSTADDVLADVDLSGTRVLVTGISSGLGLETAHPLPWTRARRRGVGHE